MKYWLIKTEPGTYSWNDLVKKGKDHWDGVRNYQARNNIREMRPDDLCLFYHSVKDKTVVGMARVTSEPYPDPTTDDDRWVVVDVVPEEKFKHPVSLQEIKSEERLQQMVLVNNTRLSVQPVRKEEFDIVVAMGMKETND